MLKDETSFTALTQMSMTYEGIKARLGKFLVQFLCDDGLHTVMRLPKDRDGMLVLLCKCA